MKADFINFLRRNGAFGEYQKHMKDLHHETLYHFLDSRDPSDYLGTAFNWLNSPGCLYWEKLNTTWWLIVGVN